MKKLVTAAMVVAFALSSASFVMAKSEKCKVESVDGDKVCMVCEGTKMKAGDKVKVKSAAKKAVEGC